MAMEINQNYNNYAAWGMAGNGAANNVKKREAEKTSQIENEDRAKRTAEYVRELEKLVPSVEFKVGSGFSSAKSGKTLTINPQLLEKMQTDPEQEKETKELIRGVESAMKMIESVNKASGWTIVFKHSYIDENGKYRSMGYYRNDFMLNMSAKLREERRQNSAKLLERQKEKVVKKQEKQMKISEERKMEEAKEESKEKSVHNRVKELLDKKTAAAKGGRMYLKDADFKELIEAAKEDDKEKADAKEDHATKADAKEQAQAGANLDLQA